MVPADFYASYLATYLERDVRNITQVHNLSQFQRFVELCAGRSGQILNKAGLANDYGISSSTAEEWLSVLEASFIIYRLRPYYKNLNKRIIKSPKLYFFDTGLLCYLLRIETKDQLRQYPLRGEIFETFIVNELLKSYFNKGKREALYYFRESNNNEIDIICDTYFGPVPLEIKSGETVNSEFFKGLRYFSTLVNTYKKSGLVTGRNIREDRSDFFIRGYAGVYELHDILVSDENRKN